MKILIQDIRDRAAERPPGYVNDCISRGQVIGDSLELSDEQFEILKAKYRSELPGLNEMLSDFASAVLRWATAGFPIVDKTVFQSRIDICLSCMDWTNNRCARCGCYEVKHWMGTEQCPIGKWN
jgi:hypothetical protein